MDRLTRIFRLHQLFATHHYPVAWCYLRDQLRNFALERVSAAALLAAPARELSDADLDAHFKPAYGLFSGAPEHTAVLHFSPQGGSWIVGDWFFDDDHG